MGLCSCCGSSGPSGAAFVWLADSEDVWSTMKRLVKVHEPAKTLRVSRVQQMAHEPFASVEELEAEHAFPMFVQVAMSVGAPTVDAGAA